MLSMMLVALRLLRRRFADAQPVQRERILQAFGQEVFSSAWIVRKTRRASAYVPSSNAL